MVKYPQDATPYPADPRSQPIGSGTDGGHVRRSAHRSRRIEEGMQPGRVDRAGLVLCDGDQLVSTQRTVGLSDPRGRQDDVATVASEVDMLARHLPRPLLGHRGAAEVGMETG